MLSIRKWQRKLLCPTCARASRGSNSQRWLGPLQASECHTALDSSIVLCWSFPMAQDCFFSYLLQAFVFCFSDMRVLVDHCLWSLFSSSGSRVHKPKSPWQQRTNLQLQLNSPQVLNCILGCSVQPWSVVLLPDKPCVCPMCPCTLQL